MRKRMTGGVAAIVELREELDRPIELPIYVDEPSGPTLELARDKDGNLWALVELEGRYFGVPGVELLGRAVAEIERGSVA